MSNGRPPKFNDEDYLDAVRKTRSLSDGDIAKNLNVNLTTVYRFRVRNRDVYEQGEEIIKSFDGIGYSDLTFDMFKFIPSIAEYKKILENKDLSKYEKNHRVRVIYNVCHHLKVHPDKLTLDDVSLLCMNMRDLKKGAPKGLKYYNIVKSIRNWFQLMHDVSAERLNVKGLNAGRTEGDGKYASERVTKEQRKTIEDTMWDACRKHNKKLRYMDYSLEKAYNEMIGICHFMYYSATRKMGTQYLHFGDKKHVVDNDYLELHVVDKGNESWNKIFVDDGYKRIEDYLERNFNVYRMDELYKMTGVMFPMIKGRKYSLENKIMRSAQEEAGCHIMQPNHIWRHTFAQDCLYATNWNYELVASLGGWKTTEVLRRNYGEMNNDVKRDGLKEAMGLEVKKEIRYLRW